jgi:hypothetical protein
MESNFHSTVLQRPPSLHDYEDQQRDRDRDRDRERARDRDRGSSERRHRDILNPVQHGETTNLPPGSGSHATGQQQQHPHQPPPRHSFSLRSPTQPDFHHSGAPHFPGSSSASPSSAPSASAAANTNEWQQLRHPLALAQPIPDVLVCCTAITPAASPPVKHRTSTVTVTRAASILSAGHARTSRPPAREDGWELL